MLVFFPLFVFDFEDNLQLNPFSIQQNWQRKSKRFFSGFSSDPKLPAMHNWSGHTCHVCIPLPRHYSKQDQNTIKPCCRPHYSICDSHLMQRTMFVWYEQSLAMNQTNINQISRMIIEFYNWTIGQCACGSQSMYYIWPLWPYIIYSYLCVLQWMCERITHLSTGCWMSFDVAINRTYVSTIAKWK